MGFLKSLGEAIASFFGVGQTYTLDTPPMPPCKKYPGDISEPVWMMLRSIERNPRQWKVVLSMPRWDNELHKFIAVYKQLSTHRYPQACSVSVTVTDRNTGEVFLGEVWIDCDSLFHAMLHNACGRISEYGAVIPHGIAERPSWMTRDEADALGNALYDAYAARVSKVVKYQGREEERKAREARDRLEAKKKAERDRLTRIYTATEK